MRKDTSKKKQQIGSRAERGTRESLEFYIGIDLGDKNSDVCVLDRRGELSKEFRLRMKEEDFQTYFASIPRSRVAVEAGAQSRWVAELIEKCGHEVYVSNTRKVPYIHQSDDKDDVTDELAALIVKRVHVAVSKKLSSVFTTVPTDVGGRSGLLRTLHF